MAETLHMKIHSYDSDSNHLLVSFCTDESNKSVEEYQPVAFQPHQFDGLDAQEIINEIAKTGYHIATAQDAKEQFVKNSGKVVDLTDLVGTTQSFAIADIIPTEVPVADSLTDIVVK